MLIDLDVPPPERAPRKRADWRRPAKPVLAALLLLVLGGAASPARADGLVEVGSTGGLAVSAHLLTPAALYIADVPGQQVRAIPLVPGGPKWITAVNAVKPVLSLATGGATVVVEPGAEGAVTFLDARTGRERWQAPEFAAVRVLGNRVAVWSSPGPLRMADLTTGRTIWQADANVALLDGAGGLLFAVDPIGLATVYAVADGKVQVKDRNLNIDPYGWAVADSPRYSAESVIGDTLYVQGPSSVNAYRLRDLSRRWRSKIKEPRTLSRCAGVLCATGPDGISALDPATGRVLWSADRWRAVTADLVVTAADGRSALLDPRTGRVLRDLGRGGPVGDLMLVFDRDLAWVTGLADGRVRGVLPLVAPSSCDRAGEFLACPAAGGTVTVWTVRR